MREKRGSSGRWVATEACWWRLVLAAITALVVGVLVAGTASATTAPELGNRVGASTPVAVNIVGPHESIAADRWWGHAPPGAGIVVATGVAANTAAKACSFAGSTLVLMADGTKRAIANVKVGDKVVATDPETGEQEAKTVEHVWVHDDTVTDLVIDGDVITTTEDHPFWSVTDQRFERADELEDGEKVLGADGDAIAVSGLKIGTERDAVAYNLAVEGIHTYHVGDADVLVHNTCDIRGLWQITKEGTAATKQGPFGTVSKSKSDGLWWSRDTAGHGGSTWKVYEESSRGLIWRADANQYGDFIVGKHKSDVGTFIPWKDLN